jgi:indolepyruvate ferredoxin oxidoreductase alpha subunit
MELKRFVERGFKRYSMMGLEEDNPGKTVLMNCNEALARGAIEAGVRVVTSYPGSPVAYVIENLAPVAKQVGMYVEWSANEKLAFEVALGAVITGVRALMVTKNVGLNWALDPLATATMYGTPGLVLAVADDPGAETTSNEQDTRYLAMFTETIVLEPATMQEMKDFTVIAFSLSEQTRLPVMVRVMERMGWGREPVTFGTIDFKARARRAKFNKRSDPWATNASFPWPVNSLSAKHMRYHGEGPTSFSDTCGELPTAKKTAEAVENFPHNVVSMSKGAKVGVITSGMCYPLVIEALRLMGMPKDVAILKLATTYPLPKHLVMRLLDSVEQVLVVEEIEPFIEHQVRSISADMNSHAQIRGKLTGDIPFTREQERNVIGAALSRLTGREYRPRASYERLELGRRIREENPDLFSEHYRFCPGCPEWAALCALRTVCDEMGLDFVGFGDNGCHECSHWPPLELENIAGITMGSGVGYGQGMYHAGLKDKMIAITGDSCFFHAVMPALANAVYNKANILLYVMDNRTSAMTGHQPHPGAFGITATNEPTEMLDIAEVARALHADFVEVVDPYDQSQTRHALEKAIKLEGVSVIVARRPCAVIALRQVSA